MAPPRGTFTGWNGVRPLKDTHAARRAQWLSRRVPAHPSIDRPFCRGTSSLRVFCRPARSFPRLLPTRALGGATAIFLIRSPTLPLPQGDYSGTREQQCLQWVEDLTGLALSGGDFGSALRVSGPLATHDCANRLKRAERPSPPGPRPAFGRRRSCRRGGQAPSPAPRLLLAEWRGAVRACEPDLPGHRAAHPEEHYALPDAREHQGLHRGLQGAPHMQ